MIRTFAAVLAAALLLAGPARAEPQTLFVTVTAAEAQTQAMAMILSLQSLKAGADVEILLCGPGGDMALADDATPKLKTGIGPMSPQDFLRAAMKAGANARVCAIYLPNSGHGEDDLIDGVTAAAPPEIAKILLHPATRTFTF